MVGFGMVGLVTEYPYFVLAALTITIGEMVFFPSSSTLTAKFAPAEMRGRYMAVAHFAWSVPATIGPATAGFILDHFAPQLLWYIGAGVCAVSALGFYALHSWLGAQERFVPAKPEQSSSASS
jgi:MFS family permease